MQCPFCERNELTELMRNGHGNIAYDCPLCGIVHKSEFPDTAIEYRDDEFDTERIPFINGDKCAHCGSTDTERMDTICDDPAIWVCECLCGKSFEVAVQPTE